MKEFLILLVLFNCVYNLSGQTQSELNEQAHQAFLEADKELNEVYNKIQRDFKADTTFIKNLKKAQKIWIQLRDAEMETKFPKRELGYYGSVFLMCWSLYKEELTKERIEKLKKWLMKKEEGYVCD
jgi:uncharacterized protein YecT (DUF1311 family)